ncbi:MAG: DinB family protein [Acidobacteriaceae bacterium]|nr:DinB family protein [Acidobacteriaceae bacterium]MBV9782086.1 DinB family protein [Acidobacteriaceae bacterium]
MKKLLAVFSLAGLQMFAQSSASSQSSAAASTPNANPLTGATKYMWEHTKNDLLKSAEEMPEENYSFKPAATVRSFGQIIGHVADAQYEFCSAVIGDGKQPPGIEKSKTSKADLIQALKDGFAYCDQAYANMTDARAAETIKFFGHDAPKLSILTFNIGHNMEHYGNLVTYLRMKGLVPPSSQQQSM